MVILDPVARARAIVGLPMPYELGSGDYAPKFDASGMLVEDLPWTTSERGKRGADCAGFAICYCHRIKRHEPGFNRTATATVCDDYNTDSAVEDALGARTVFAPIIAPTLGIALAPAPGDLLVYKTIRLPGHPYPWIGHVCIVLEVDPRFDPHAPDWRLLKVAQCFGGDDRIPAVEITDGLFWHTHDEKWGTDPVHGRMLDRLSVVIRPIAG